MDDLPLDTSHPMVRDYIKLIRLQVLTPLSLLINIATVMVCSLVVTPNLGAISKLYPSAISPEPRMIAAYIVLLYLCQIGYCILLVLARKPETKNTLVKGVGLPLVFANWIMAGWAIAWLLQAFLVSTILLGILLVLLLYANIVLLVYHAPTRERPLDIALIHAPMRAFLILPLNVLFWFSLFITRGWTWSPGEPQHYGRYQWAGLIVVLSTNILGFIIIILRRDIVWCVAATWICASIWSLNPKPFPVWVAVVVFTVLHPIGLIASWLLLKLRRGRNEEEGRIHLPTDHEDEAGPDPGQRGPREVDAEALWG
ncbi:hypothetical protein BDY19DRAFT_102072 [Irpex rosettiformis]|uniref:Uncharacterized protein n=1 Tax=Irpex rosettiformis TaxID=378272 RepID=A0ACB8U4U5_9APHY|nr:hypothetical protein BDY19DRAFT_102072 [Irpex rosettiformis]